MAAVTGILFASKARLKASVTVAEYSSPSLSTGNANKMWEQPREQRQSTHCEMSVIDFVPDELFHHGEQHANRLCIFAAHAVALCLRGRGGMCWKEEDAGVLRNKSHATHTSF